MRVAIARLGAAVVLAFSAWVCWREADLVDRVADAKARLATLRFDADRPYVAGARLSDYLPGAARPLADDLRKDEATIGYWSSRYSEVMTVGRGDVDADVLLTAANAAFRTSQRAGGAGQLAAQRLDGVLQAYAAVLKAVPSHADAAYNYEYVARVRDAVARGPLARPKGVVPADPDTRKADGDLPSGPTLHGRPGGPPPDTRAEEFEVLAPMEFGDREAQPEATPGGKLPRKG